MNEKVIILLATHNRADLIGATLDSIIAQTYRNWDCLIVDDFSYDKTPEIVKKFTERESRIQYFQKPIKIKRGLSASRNYGLELAEKLRPDFIQFFDDDDLMHPQKLELQVKSLRAHSIAQFSLCGWRNFHNFSKVRFDETQNMQKSTILLGEAYLTGKIKFVAQVPLFRYSYAKKFQFDEDLFYAEEWVLFSMQFLLNKPNYIFIEEILFYRRKHENSITERKDINFQKSKTRAIVGIKVFNYLKEHKIHSRTTLIYFSRRFLLYQYDSNLLDQIQELFKNSNHWDYLKFKSARKIHWFFRKLILKILNL